MVSVTRARLTGPRVTVERPEVAFLQYAVMLPTRAPPLQLLFAATTRGRVTVIPCGNLLAMEPVDDGALQFRQLAAMRLMLP